MLTLVLGRAGTGKTSYIMNDIRRRAAAGETKLLLLVPEQYSHDAERQLCKICGDGLSLHGEALSFSRLCNRVFAETGGAADGSLDDGGRLLVMNRALDAAGSQLKIYARSERKADFLNKLLQVSKEFKSACITPVDIEAAASGIEGSLSDKLHDLSLILSAYDSFFHHEASNPDDKLTRLAEALKDSSLGEAGRIYIDGFTDFTAQEMRVLRELMKKNAELTVCLTCDRTPDDDSKGTEEIFETSRRTAELMLRSAAEHGLETSIIEMKAPLGHRAEELLFLEKNLFCYSPEQYAGENTAVELHMAAAPAEECAYAAYKILELVKKGYRWRDIAVMTCDGVTYNALAENIFEQYGIPVFVSRKTEILQKPPAALIGAALDIIENGWEYDAVFRYLKTGLTGISPPDCDELENYVLKWNIRGVSWTREEDWVLPPSGYERSFDGKDEERLERLNSLRRRIVAPLVALHKEMRDAGTTGGKLRALYGFLENIRLPERLQAKAEDFFNHGEIQLRDEYVQLWDILKKAMEQYDAIMGDASCDLAGFSRLWSLLLSQYDVGVIPVSLDRVGLGDMSRQRRRDIKCLIVLGASDDFLPNVTDGGGVLSDSERGELAVLGIDIAGTTEERLYREMNGIYSSFTLPTDKLIVTYPETGLTGGEKRPSFIVKRLKLLFVLAETGETAGGAKLADMIRTAAFSPCFELAAESGRSDNPIPAAAYAYFSSLPDYAEKLDFISRTAVSDRGSLSDDKASKLYGHKLTMSASRVDKFYACRFEYFLQYGLNAKPRKPAGFDAPVAGTFMHYILENVTRDIKNTGGFTESTDEACRALTAKYVKQYISDVLLGFQDKTSRFKYLFRRIVKDTETVVLDMVRELRNSDFAPIDFELEFSEAGPLPPATLSDGLNSLSVKGFVDRVDGWVNDGRLFLRVVDYKTGRKSFSLSDIWYGMGMQMLIYLFTLQKYGRERYKMEIEPAGVLYAPARDIILPVPRNATDEAIEEQRLKKLKRSGLILNDEDVVEAMERGKDKKYLPVKTTKDGFITGESLADLEQLGRLSVHIDKMLLEIAGGVKTGSIAADPYFRGPDDNACSYCDYGAACHFSESGGDKRRYLKKLKADEAWEKITGRSAE